MRHLFDQYDGDENRLTHALVCCLSENRKMLRAFARWATGTTPPHVKSLSIVEQALPGEEDGTALDEEQKGLPDAWIHNDDTWSLIIESKVSAPVTANQLSRHRRTALRRGFTDSSILVISPSRPSSRVLVDANHRTWSEVYTWLSTNTPRFSWADRMVRYMEIAETRMAAKGYLNSGTITRFSGIPFDADHPYEYREAKRVLQLALDELLQNKHLRRLGIDPSQRGRPKITGKASSSVWDCLTLKNAVAKKFTEAPHLTMSIRQRGHVLVMVTIPNGVRTSIRRNMIHMGQRRFCDIILGIATDLTKRLKKAKEAKPWMDVVQRHFLTQGSNGIEDARLEYDLRTALGRNEGRKKAGDRVKNQPEWLDATYEAWSKKRSNLQIGVGAIFPFNCAVLHTREALRYFAETWLACETLIGAALGR